MRTINGYFSIVGQEMETTKEDIIKAFDHFYRAENGSVISGTSLGLLLIKYIIDEHNGIIELSASAERGTRETFKLHIQF